MKKRFFAFLLVCALCVAMTPVTNAVGEPEVSVYIDGQLFDAQPVTIIDSTTYVPFRAFCQSMADVAVTWDDAARTATAAKPGFTVSVGQNSQYIFANGRYFYLQNGSTNVNDCLMVPVREIAKAFGASVTWSEEKNAVLISRGTPVLNNDGSFYDSASVYWLSRIIYCESGGEPLMGQIAVGNVVMNRVKSGKYPNSIYSVIFDPYQFGPAYTGTIERTPSDTAVIAAKICLEGYNVVGDSLYFINPNSSDNSEWFTTSLRLNTVIGNHAFYA